MTPARFFAPSFVAVVGSHFVAVDKIQPVGVVVSRRGEVLSVASWASQAGPPSSSPWPNRRVGVGAEHLLVQDLPDGRLVRVDVRPDGTLVTDPVPERSSHVDEVSFIYPRLVRAVQGDDERPGDSWRFRSHLDGLRWSASVERSRGGETSAWSAGRGSIVAHAVHDEAAAVSVRRADKRPWRFDPVHDLYVLSSEGTRVLSPVKIDRIDISDGCWPCPIGTAELSRTIPEYLGYSIGEGDAATREGGTDVRICLRDLDRRPLIEISFAWAHFPGVRFSRFDEPLNELGHLAGLRALNIALEEDLKSNILHDLIVENGRAVL